MALAVDVADKAADRHRGERAIRNEIVPVAIAQLGDIELECGNQVLRVLGRQGPRGERGAQAHGDGIVGIAAQESGLQTIEQRELLGRRQRRMVGNIVRRAHEIIERPDHLAMARMNEKGRDREIFVPVALA